MDTAPAPASTRAEGRARGLRRAELAAACAALALLVVALVTSERRDDTPRAPARAAVLHSEPTAAPAIGDSGSQSRSRTVPAVSAPAPRPAIVDRAAGERMAAERGAAGAAAEAAPAPAQLGIDAVRERWRGEAPDAAWTARVSAHLNSAMSDLAVEGNVASVVCRSTICRAELRFRDAREASRFAEDAGRAEGAKWMTYAENDGQISVEIFAPRSNLP